MASIPNRSIDYRKEALRCAKAAAQQLKLLRAKRETAAEFPEVAPSLKQGETGRPTGGVASGAQE
jgi:hypothetical protein